MITKEETPRSYAAWQSSIDDTGCVTRMELIWDTMEQLERENLELETENAQHMKAISLFLDGEELLAQANRELAAANHTLQLLQGLDVVRDFSRVQADADELGRSNVALAGRLLKMTDIAKSLADAVAFYNTNGGAMGKKALNEFKEVCGWT